MAHQLDPSPEMGAFNVEVRRESFWLHGPFETFDNDKGVEFLLTDIPQIRAALDQVEAHLTTPRG